VYYIPKLIFSHDFPVKVGDAYYITVGIVFEFSQYMKYVICNMIDDISEWCETYCSDADKFVKVMDVDVNENTVHA